jgi:hypothetical protein
MQRKIVATLGTAVIIASTGFSFSCVDEDSAPETQDADFRTHVTPIFVPDNASCKELMGEGFIELKVEPVADGVYSDGTLTVMVDVRDTPEGQVFDWESNIGVDGVFAKGGTPGNLYLYDEETEDTGLHAPVNPANGFYFGLSHISFCYDLNLEVSKTAETSFKRTWTWDIDKRLADPSQSSLLLQLGQSVLLKYIIDVDGQSQDSDWKVEGTITIHNPASVAATITDVEDEISGFAGPVMIDCGVTFPHSLPAGQTLECDYEAMLPNGNDRINTATVTTSGSVGGDSGTADVEFSNTPTDEVDPCVDVYDQNSIDQAVVFLGEVCRMDDSFEREIWYTAEECSPPDIVNTAWLEIDGDTIDEDSVTIPVEVTCEDTCSLTQGYWKTHSEKGPAPYDDTWALLPNGAHTLFFMTGKSWYKVFWTPVGGNACISLAHQWMAAKLNYLAGADLSAVQAEFDAAKALLATLDSNFSPCPKQLATQLATKLDKYNNGIIGPGHCDE